MPITLDQKQLLKSFNHAAATYEAAIAIPKIIGLRLAERLEIMRLQPEIILDIGCATGYLSQHLAEHYPKANIFGVDFAINLLLTGRSTILVKRTNSALICANAYYLPVPSQSVDLILSNLTLAWCDNITALFTELKRVLKPQGLLLFTTLGPDTLQELKQCWHTIDPAHSHVHTFFDMHTIGDMLVHTQFADPVMDVEKLTIHYADLSALMQDLKYLGMHNITNHRQRGLNTPRQLARLTELYDNYRSPTQQLPATIEVIYGHAWAPALIESSINSAGDVIIPISKIKRKHI